jgi:adenylosuccinate lyase
MSYVSPFAERYASVEMLDIFSKERKYRTWRDLWISLAKAEKKLGLEISDEQIRQMEQARDRIDFDKAAAWEKRLRHEVMAHIRHFGEVAPKAAGILHLGATSAFVMDNTDLIQMRDALRLIRRTLINVVEALARRARETRSIPQVAYTHFQPAQITTVGKRICLWLQDLVLDHEELMQVEEGLRFLGSKGAVGTQASFVDLFDGDEARAARVDALVAKDFGFDRCYPVTGQTYSRKVDARVLAALSSIAQSAHKAGTDLRLLQHLGEMSEPFEEEQVGSSAMPYKRNPMRAERMCSLARVAMSHHATAAMTASTQWLERTLDDSAAKRIAVPEAFFAADAALHIWLDIARGLAVHRERIAANVAEHFPFIATERLLMEGVKAGGDRQELHEAIRRHALEAHEAMRGGRKNDLLERLRKVGKLGEAIRARPKVLDPSSYVGRAPAQVAEFLRDEVDPLLKKGKKWLGAKSGLRV